MRPVVESSDAVSTRRFAAGSTSSWWLRNKSTPAHPASRNVHTKRRPLNDSSIRCSPQLGIRLPLRRQGRAKWRRAKQPRKGKGLKQILRLPQIPLAGDFLDERSFRFCSMIQYPSTSQEKYSWRRVNGVPVMSSLLNIRAYACCRKGWEREEYM